jgi:hypothetical protein
MSGALIDAAAVARFLNVDVGFVYEHASELGVPGENGRGLDLFPKDGGVRRTLDARPSPRAEG